MKKINILIITYILVFFNSNLQSNEDNKILKIGLLAPLSGEYKELGDSLLYSLKLALNEIDALMVGPYDLSQSLGVPGEIEHPVVIRTIRDIVSACLAKGISVGTFTDTPEQAAMWMEQGIRYIANAVDMGIFYNAVSKLVSELKRGVK